MSEQKVDYNSITDSNLEEFKKLVRRAVFLKHDEEQYFKAIPNDKWRTIFAVNFDGNFEYARRVLLNKFKDIERIDTALTDKEKNKIYNLDKATKFVTDAIDKNEKILFITDFDNDGSLAQAIINEYLTIDKAGSKNMIVEYAQTVNGNSNRGFTVDHVDLIVEKKGVDPQSEFLIVTADNGINSREEQKKILAKYPKAKIVVTDHHNPDEQMVVEENDRTVIFNPHYKPTPFFQRFNISGAATVGVLLKNVLAKRYSTQELEEYSKNFEKINTLFKVSNLLDYVNTHPADKPEKDYIITKFLQLQPLMNINNSISKIITGEISTDAISALEKKIPKLDVELLHNEAENIHIQNHVAKVLLHIYRNKDSYKKNDGEDDLTEANFNSIFLKEINNTDHYNDHQNINPNYIEQLRPLIFSLSADYDKNTFLDALNNKMVDVFEAVKVSERRIGEELRRGEVITKKRLENSVIAYADKNILSVFNRKFLNKVYNDENPGFSLTLDNIDKAKVSGSFRSLYNISDILKDKSKLEKQLGVKIETPGHEKAAGFILKSTNPEKRPIDESVIEAVNVFINNSIAKIKEKELKSTQSYLLTDLSAIHLIDRINTVVRGNVSNFERITPLLKLTPDTIWTDSYTTKQYTMEEIIKDRKYGYITINTNFDGGTVIVPVELVRRIVENNFNDYLSLGYMDGGVFMAEKVLAAKDAANVIDLRGGNAKTKALVEAFEKDFKEKNFVKLSREQIQDNPFFKYHDYGRLNFDLFERMVIGIIDTNKIDTLAVFDVEANGFGNSKLMNIGSMNYTINPKSGQTMDKEYFFDHFYHTPRGEEYLLKPDEVADLRPISLKEKDELPLELKKQLLIKHNDIVGNEEGYSYFLHIDAEKNVKTKKKTLGFEQIKNFIENPDGTVTFNRAIQATMLAYLVKDKDFRVPQEMINLTGITQEVLERYGKTANTVDSEMHDFYKGKKVLFGAHNTPYDARVLRANLPQMYNLLKNSAIYDSAIFAREQKLAYDDVEVAYFERVEGLKNNIFFYNNKYSEFNLTNFIKENKNGYYPDRTNNYLLEIDNGEYYLVDKVKHEKVKINATQEEMLARMNSGSIPNTSVKFSVEKLSEQWMIHSLLLCDEEFDIKHVDLNKPEYSALKAHEEALKFFQDNYHFDISAAKNIGNFMMHYGSLGNGPVDDDGRSAESEQMAQFVSEFLELNKNIQQKFSDAWMYKQVLEIKDPSRSEVTNDLVDLVNYQTNIPKDKIRTIFDEALRFKEKFKVDHILQHEMHANGPWRTDVKGDIAFEDKLTLSLLAQREYNSYDHNVKNAIDYFNQIKIKARIAFDIADNLSDDLAQDSYSFRQGILYDRDSLTPMISTIQEKENKLGDSSNRQLVKFKLENDVLPQDAAVYGIIKKDVQINREHIEEHKQKLSFILLNEQIKSSLHNVDSIDDKENLRSIIEANEKQIIAYKQELSNFYEFVEYNRKDYQMKQFIDKAKEMLIEGKVPKRAKEPPMHEVDEKGLQIIKNVLDNLINECASTDVKEINPTTWAKINESLENMKKVRVPTRIEQALQTPHQEINNFEEINEPNFLHSVEILRQKPVERIVNKHQEFRLVNNLIKQNQEYVLECQKTSNIKRKP